MSKFCDNQMSFSRRAADASTSFSLLPALRTGTIESKVLRPMSV